MDSVCIANYYNMNGAPIDTTAIWNVLYSNDATLINAGLNYFDNRFRTDANTEGSLTFLAGVSGPPFPSTRGQWRLWADYCGAFTSNISGKTIQPTSYEGGFNFFSTAISGTNPVNGQTITTTDARNAMFAYWGSSQYAQFLTDATNANLAAGFDYPAQFCVVSGGFNNNSPFALKEPNRLAADIPAYTAFRALNGR